VVLYSYDGGPVIEARRPESYRLTLPEDPWLRERIQKAEREGSAELAARDLAHEKKIEATRAELGARINRLLEEKNSAEDELAALKARAERDTHSDPVAPTIGIMIERVVMEPIDSTLGRNYPRKLRIFFRENAGDEIYLGQANWVPGGIHAEQGKRFACQFELGEGGKFTGESPEKLVSPGKRMRLYVGLDSRVPEEEAKRMTEQRLLGTLLIPATARGKNMTLAIKL
jgi:hypothetical protein